MSLHCSTCAVSITRFLLAVFSLLLLLLEWTTRYDIGSVGHREEHRLQLSIVVCTVSLEFADECVIIIPPFHSDWRGRSVSSVLGWLAPQRTRNYNIPFTHGTVLMPFQWVLDFHDITISVLVTSDIWISTEELYFSI